MNRPLVFLDRDGTLIKEPSNKQIDSLDKLELKPKLFSGFSLLKPFNPRYILISNQDNLGTKNYPKSSFKTVQNKLVQILSSENINFEKVLVCPHAAFDNCLCRKPSRLLIDQYLKNENLQSKRSVVIGDRKADYELAKNLGSLPLIVGRNLKKFNDQSQELDFEQACAKAFLYFSQCHLVRQTKETTISANLSLAYWEKSEINTGLGFFNHLLEQLIFHGAMNLKLSVEADLHVDDHHMVEDVALVLGQLVRKIYEKTKTSKRYYFKLPMDESLAECCIDFSNRPIFKFKGEFKREKINDLSTEMIEHFFHSFSFSAGLSLHISVKGRNEHHKAEALFKCLGQALSALGSDQRLIIKNKPRICSTKGIL